MKTIKKGKLAKKHDLWRKQLGVKTFKEARAKGRLEELRNAIKAKNISYGEIAELQNLVKYIDKSDTLLLEWAGVKE